MPQTTGKDNSSKRRRAKLELLGTGLVVMRHCRNCSRTGKECRVSDGSEKCVECVRLGNVCDLASLNTNKWKRLERERKKLKQEAREAMARLQRLHQQIDSVEEKQQHMVNDELRNIEELEEEENSLLPTDPTINVASEQIALPEIDGN